MQASSGTSSLRRSAARWSLAGDKLLLDVLQEIHQNMISKCEKTNSALASLTNALADADIALQTVNNRMMALSNSQFVESRVYDDELPAAEEVTEHNTPTKISESESEISKLKRGIKTLESMHEVVEIHHDSESDTDSDLELYSSRVVLKPLDVYADRPLPYIIGSHAWKTKWHAGLYPEDSDSESESSREYEQPQDIPEVPSHVEAVEQLESSCSSEVGTAEMSQAEVAAALARRLAGDAPQIQERDVEYTVPESTAVKKYQPKPLSAVHEPIFFDEPPPLDQTYQSEEDTYSQEGDIFAELYKSKTKAPGNSTQNRVTDELFSDFGSNIEGDLFGHVDNIEPKVYGVQHQNTSETRNIPGVSQDKETPQLHVKSMLPEEDNKSKLVTQSNENPIPASKQEAEAAVKKPVGGISLFGNNEGAERIGAAILRRNQRKSSTSSSDLEKDNIPEYLNKEKPQHTENDQQKELKSKQNLINHLFAKQEKTKPAGQNIKPTIKERKVVEQEKKIDLFSDNLFDDVDDIFTSNIVVKIPKKKDNMTEKSIFDNDDDLFAEVAVKKDTKETNISATAKNLFDSDDELFSEKNIKKSADMLSTPKSTSHVNSSKSVEPVKNVPIGLTNEFGEESDDDIFSGVKSFGEKNKEQTQNDFESDTEKSDVHITSGIVTQLKSNVIEDSYRQEILQSDVNRSTAKESTDIFSQEKPLLQETKYSDFPKNTPSQRFPIRDDNTKYEDIDDNRKLSSEHVDDVSVLKTEDIRSETVSSYEPEAPIRNLSGLDIVLPKTTEEDNVTYKDYNFTEDHKVLNVTSIKSPSIFDDDDDDDLFETKTGTGITSQHGKEKPVGKPNKQLDSILEIPNESRMKKATKNEIQVDKMDNIRQKLLDTQSPGEPDTFFLPPNLLHSDKNKIFSNTFDEQPPVFEKPKEPKKSKNINALFDDDSDDEALFFKRNDVDDKPEDLTAHNNQDKLFDIFHDEPPAFDIDFIPKASKSHEISVHDILTKQQDLEQKQNLIASQIERDFPVPSISANEGLIKHTSDDSDYTKEVKVGKLKLPNLNINVNTLLPGASPKKIPKVTEQTDGQTISTNVHDKLSTTLLADNEVNPKPNSVSFGQQSSVLDNKFSKERAKIQVKRRPSTRHARREAVRKSMVDVEGDSTDNSSYFDNVSKKEDIEEKQNIPKEDSTINENPTNNVISKTVYILNDEDIFPNIKQQSVEKTKSQEIIKDVPKTKSLQIVDDDIDEIFKSKTDSIAGDPIAGLESNKKEIITTLGKVYMENAPNRDETSKPFHEISSTSNTQITDALQTTANIKSKNEQKVDINTENRKKPTTLSLFGDLSDEESELFGVTKAPVTSKSKIFDSDSEDELFAEANNRGKIEKKEVVQIKGSLFDNDDDDVGLFGAPGKKTKHEERDTASSVKEHKPTDDGKVRDPLSTLLGEE